MKKLLFVMSLVLFIGCGKDSVVVKEKLVYKDVVVAQEFEGSFFMNGNSFIELVASSDNEVTILRTNQMLTSLNPKSVTYGNHPPITIENLEIHNGKLSFSKDVNYSTANVYDLEEDVNGNDIIGVHRTDYLFYKLTDGRLQLRVSIFQGRTNHNINNVVARRYFTGE